MTQAMEHQMTPFKRRGYKLWRQVDALLCAAPIEVAADAMPAIVAFWAHHISEDPVRACQELGRVAADVVARCEAELGEAAG